MNSNNKQEEFESNPIEKYIFDLSKELDIEDVNGIAGHEIELIALVRNCNFLYDKNTTDFKNAEKKDLAWNAIARVMHSRVVDVQSRWRSLREQYTRSKKELQNKNQYGSETDNHSVRVWEFHDHMKFLDPHIIPRRKLGRASWANISNRGNLKDEVLENGSPDCNIEILKFISCVRERPLLYDQRHPNYRSKQDRDQAWSEVTQILGIAVSECENRWRSLRERYGRERKLKSNGIDKEWKYYNALSFLNNHVRSRRHSRFHPILPKLSIDALDSERISTSSNQQTIIIKPTEISTEDDTIQNLEFVDATKALSSRSSSITPTKSYISPNSEHCQNGNDEDELFGNLITAELRRIPSGKKKMKIKAEIYKIFYDNESDD